MLKFYPHCTTLTQDPDLYTLKSTIPVKASTQVTAFLVFDKIFIDFSLYIPM